MRWLADECVAAALVAHLRAAGHDVAYMAELAPRASDADVIRRAYDEGRLLLTEDKDFGDLAFQFGLPATCGIVLFRLQAKSSTALAKLVAKALQYRSDWAGQLPEQSVRRRQQQ